MPPRKRYKKKNSLYRSPAPQNTITVRMSGIFELLNEPDENPAALKPLNAWFRYRTLKRAYQPNSIGTTLPLSLSNYDKLYACFDQFRVNRVHLKYVPAYTNEEYDEQGKQERLPPMVISIDNDSTGPVEVKNQLSHYKTKLRDSTRPWKLSFSIPRPPGSEVNEWQDCQKDGGATLFDEGIIMINSQGAATQSRIFGTIYAVYEVSFRNRQDTNIVA